MRSVEELEELRQQLKRFAEGMVHRAKTKPDRSGNGVIAVIEWTGDDGNLGVGMIVLFSDNLRYSLKPYENVYLVDYQVRESRSGKKYVKCFRCLTEEQYGALKEDAERRLKEIEERIERQRIREEAESAARELGVSTEVVWRAVELARREMYDAAWQLLLRETGAMAALSWHYTEALLVFSARSAAWVELLLQKPWWTVKAKRITLPTQYSPYKCFSEECAMFTMDDAFEEFEAKEIAEALCQRGIPAVYTEPGSLHLADITILLPKGSPLFRKLMAVKQTDMPREIKKLVYCEVLGINPKKLPEVSKAAW